MVKIGPAFFDSVARDTKQRKRYSNFSNFSEVLNLAPFILLILVFLIIIVRLFYVQVVRGSYYKGLSDNNRTRNELLPALRGVIFDREGRPLVANSPVYKILENGKPKIVDSDTALKLISQGKPVETDIKREYLYKSAFAHVLGYVGQISQEQAAMPAYQDYGINDFLGRMGLEEQYESYLHGIDGKKLFEVDSRGNMIRELGRQEAQAGQNLKTTLNLDVGLSAKTAFDSNSPDEKGAVVVSDPRDGAILALYSSPSFDPNIFINSDKNYQAEGNYKKVSDVLTNTSDRPLLDRAISGAYPPGSTFKLISATAALEKGSIKPDTEIEDTGVLKVGTFSFGNWYFLQYGRTEGNLNIVGAIKRSNDIFFYKAAQETGVDYISSWAKKFNLGSPLGLDLPGEVKGTVPTVEWKKTEIGEQWYLGDTYNYGIGQGFLLTTPLQVNMFTDVFANQGTLYLPHLLENQKPKILKQNFINKKNIDLIRQGMVEACDTGGVAWPLFQFKVKNSNLKIDNQDYFQDASSGAQMVRVKMACKTGTAEVGGDKKPDAWITVFAPFNHPEIAVTVLVENAGEGSSIAGPIAKQILTDYFQRKNN